jgi:hypothetical protein
MVDPMGKNNAESTPEAGVPLDCEHWEALLVDKMDGTMAPEAEAAFAEHSLRCPGCADLLDQARQGQQWLKLLEEHAPAAPVHLLSKILARTQGAGHEVDYPLGTSGAAMLPGHAGRWGIPFLPHAHPGVAARGAHNARLLMTAGMAFFSVALTLSVAGVRLTSVHAAELRPQVVQANVSRSFYGTKKQVVSFYENLRLVYEVESKMHELRGDADQAPAQHKSAPGPSVPSQAAPRNPGHAVSGDGPRHPARGTDADSKHPEQVKEVLRGWPVAASYRRGSIPALCKQAGCPASSSKVQDRFLNTFSGATSNERNRI